MRTIDRIPKGATRSRRFTIILGHNDPALTLSRIAKVLTLSRRTLCYLMNNSIEAARTQMVNQQVRAWDVRSRGLEHPLDVRGSSSFPAVPQPRLADTGIPRPAARLMMSPQVEGRLLQSLTITPADSVLEVGTGSGFTACLARLAAGVVSLEIFPELAEAADQAGAVAAASRC